VIYILCWLTFKVSDVSYSYNAALLNLLLESYESIQLLCTEFIIVIVVIAGVVVFASNSS
jgi:hypothetical protein